MHSVTGAMKSEDCPCNAVLVNLDLSLLIIKSLKSFILWKLRGKIKDVHPELRLKEEEEKKR